MMMRRDIFFSLMCVGLWCFSGISIHKKSKCAYFAPKQTKTNKEQHDSYKKIPVSFCVAAAVALR